MNDFPYKIIDLTHTLSPEAPSWNGGCGFEHVLKRDYETGDAISFRVQQIKMHAGIGTHMDAPAHCIPGGRAIAEIELQNLCAPCIVIDVSSKSGPDYLVSPEDILAFEAVHGLVSRGSFVICHTGWARFWGEPERYRNGHVFPAISGGAADLLLARGIVGLGIDTLSPDRPDSGFPVHAAILGADKYIVENVANAGSLPPKGAYTLALPIKTAGGTEAPIRLVALVKG